MAKQKTKAKKREDGRYQSKLRIGISENGKPITKYFYSYVSKADADRQRAAYVASHPFQDMTALKSNYTLREWAQVWIKSYKGSLAQNTIDGYTSTCKRICNYNGLGEMDLADIKPLHISAFMNSLVGTSKSNISKKRFVLKELFRTAVDNRIIASNPAEKQTKVKGSYTGHRALSKDEVDLITANYARHRGGIAIMLMLWAGLRRGEALALKWGDIDFFKKQIIVKKSLDIKHKNVKTTKTEAGDRIVPLFAPLFEALMQAHKPDTPATALICVTASGKQYTETAFNRMLSGFCCSMERAANGIPEPADPRGWRRDRAKMHREEAGGRWIPVEFTAHDLRYTFATLCYDANVDVQTTKTWMGHESIETTMRIYTKLSAEKQTLSTAAMDKFAAKYSNNAKAKISEDSDTLLTPSKAIESISKL